MHVLNIHPDDGVDIVVEIERRFGITIADEEVARCQTVGDLSNAVLASVPFVERSNTLPCFSASAFRVLRSSLKTMRPGFELRPSTPLSDIIGRDVKAAWMQLGSKSDLELPRLRIPAGVLALVVGLLVSPLACLAFNLISRDWFFVIEVATSFMAFAMVKLSPRLLPSEQVTLGDLARAAAQYNIGRFSLRYGAVRRADVMQTVESTIRDVTGIRYVTPDSLFVPAKA